MAGPPHDIAGIESLLDDGERAVRDRIRAFVEERVAPRAQEDWETARFPVDLLLSIGELGIVGAHLKGYGCAGWNSVAYGLALAEIARGSASVATTVHVQSGLAMTAISLHGSEEQKQRWLPRMARFEAVGSFAATEPEAGSDLGSLATTARTSGGEYVIDGHKRWIGHGTLCDVAVVWARDDDGKVGGFLVERGTSGYEPRKIDGKGSQRAVWQADILLRDCRIPLENRLPGARGLGSALQVLTHSRFGVAWDALGQADDCYEAALAHVGERRQFGKPLATRQLVQQKLVFMGTELALAWALTIHVARLKDEGRASPAAISMCKMNNTAKARTIAAMARDLLGGDGILLERRVMTHMADLEGPFTYEGPHDVNMLIVGEAITGERAY
jgi:glutaryl-CoA dehydrogenase